ncbi:MAG: carbohydrate ABC transporter permease [Oscillospiraceae bacterium]|nr:carbohydrate ABC transporter permease [Oscillospiraceae bacterium]
MNTVIVVIITVVVTIISASLCAYGIRRFKFKEVQAVYYIVISGLFVPIQAVILPIFRLLKSIGLINTLPGLALIYIGVNIPLSMILFTGFYKSIPIELEEAATIDGCSPMGAYWRIIFPLSKTIISTLIILVGLNIWKDFFIPLVVITTPQNKTLAFGLLAFVNEFTLDWTHLCAAMVMQSIPIIVLFLFLQKYFVSGVVSGAIKG